MKCYFCPNQTGRKIAGKAVCDSCFLEKRPDLHPEAFKKKAESFVPEGGALEEVTQTPEKPDTGQGFGDYLCPQCKVTHRAGSKIHKRHLKLLKDKPAE